MKPEEYLKKAKEAVDKALAEKKMAKEMISSLGPAIIETLQPILEAIASNSKTTREEFLDAIGQIKIEVPEIATPKAEVTVTIPEIKVPQAEVTVKNDPIDTKGIESAIKSALSDFAKKEIKVAIPDIKIPEIKIPTIVVPEVKMPDKMKIQGEVGLRDVDNTHPLPVTIVDGSGKPVGMMGGGGGKTDFFTIKDIRASSISVIDQDVGALRVVGNLTASLSGSTQVTLTNFDGLAYNSDNPLPITGSLSTTPGATFYASDAIGSTNVIQLGGNSIAVGAGVDGVGVQRVVHVTDVAQSVYVIGASGTIGTVIINPDGNPTYAGSSSGLTDAELRATAVPVSQVSGANFSVFVTDIFGSTITTGVLNSDNRIKVSVETGGSGLTDAELRASSIPVQQVSGSSWSTSVVSITDIFSTTSASAVVNPDNRVKVELPTGSSGLTDTELRASHLDVQQVSGAIDSVYVTGIFGTTFVGSDFVNSDNRLRVSVETGGSGLTDSELRASSVPIAQVSGAVFSTEVTNTVTITGSLTSTVSVGDTVSDAADSGSAPVKVGGIARTTNPTAVADGDRVSSSHDDVGRQIVRPIQARDLLQTAYATLTNGTETTLLAGSASTFFDLIHVFGASNSDAAVIVDIRDATGGGIVSTLTIPPSSMGGYSARVPVPQNTAAGTWTADMNDVTGTTVYITALFSKEV